MDLSGLSSIYTDYLDTATQEATTNKLTSAIQDDYSGSTDEELMDVCKEFEAYFLEQVFKEMQKTVPESEESSSSSSLVDFYQDKTTQELAAQSTEQNSLGIAQALYEQMKRNYDL